MQGKQQVREALRDYLLMTATRTEGLSSFDRIAALQHRVAELEIVLPELIRLELTKVIQSILTSHEKGG